MKPLAFALLGCAILVRRHRRRARVRRRRDIVADTPRGPGSAFVPGLFDPARYADPRDVLQSIDEVAELRVVPLDLDAQSRTDAEAAQDLAGLEIEIDETEIDDDLAIAIAEAEPVDQRDAGDLYGGHTPAAAHREQLDDDRAFAEGQNWIEALEASAIENGPEPERELDDIVDDEDVLRPPHPSDTRDRPVADHGSGGRRGL
jgi:hypothetical protein